MLRPAVREAYRRNVRFGSRYQTTKSVRRVENGESEPSIHLSALAKPEGAGSARGRQKTAWRQPCKIFLMLSYQFCKPSGTRIPTALTKSFKQRALGAASFTQIGLAPEANGTSEPYDADPPLLALDQSGRAEPGDFGSIGSDQEFVKSTPP
jgi:hypothetical protein